MYFLSTLSKISYIPSVLYIKYLRPLVEKLAYKEDTPNKTSLTYYSNGKKYKVIFSKEFSIPLVFKAFSNKIDVTEELLSYLGPCYDFHNQRYSPEMLNMSNLTIVVDGNRYDFKSSELIVIPE